MHVKNPMTGPCIFEYSPKGLSDGYVLLVVHNLFPSTNDPSSPLRAIMKVSCVMAHQGHSVGFKHTCSSASRAFNASICASVRWKSNTSRLAMILAGVSDLGRGMKLGVSAWCLHLR